MLKMAASAVGCHEVRCPGNFGDRFSKGVVDSRVAGRSGGRSRRRQRDLSHGLCNILGRRRSVLLQQELAGECHDEQQGADSANGSQGSSASPSTFVFGFGLDSPE